MQTLICQTNFVHPACLNASASGSLKHPVAIYEADSSNLHQDRIIIQLALYVALIGPLKSEWGEARGRAPFRIVRFHFIVFKAATSSHHVSVSSEN